MLYTPRTLFRTLGHAAKTGALLTGMFFAAPISAQIMQVDYASLTGTQFISFATVAGGPPPGTNYDGILVASGVAFGERFFGQTLTAVGDFDQLSGVPIGDLTLLAGAANHNLAPFQNPAGQVLSGIGTSGFPNNNAIGEGAVSLLFSSGQSEFGFRLTGGNGGGANISFFSGNGALIQSFLLGNLPLNSLYGFSRTGQLADIRGISIWNNDVTGIGLRDFRHDVISPVPESETWAMMIVGFGAVGAAIRRRRHSTLPRKLCQS